MQVEFYWDVASPYTYLAATQLETLERETGAEILYRPILLGGVFQAIGSRMPASIPAKGAYMDRDLRRWRAHYGVPFKIPVAEVVFPIRSLLPMRVAVALEARDLGRAYATQIMHAYWAEGEDVSEPSVVGSVLTKLGVEAEEVLTEAGSQPIKDRLRTLTDEAVNRGVFGAPTFFVGSEMFWGNDRLGFVHRALTQGK